MPEKPVPPRALRSAHGYWIGLVFLLVIPVVILALRWRVGDFRDLKQAVVLPALEHSSEKGF